MAEKRSAEKGRDEGDCSAVENVMDNESVKDLGDTTDFLNMASHQLWPNSVLYILWRFHTEVITKVLNKNLFFFVADSCDENGPQWQDVDVVPCTEGKTHTQHNCQLQIFLLASAHRPASSLQNYSAWSISLPEQGTVWLRNSGHTL